MTSSDILKSWKVLEVGDSLSGALCGSHLGALGLDVVAFRSKGFSGVSPEEWGWDYCKVVREAEAPSDVTGFDVVIDSTDDGTFFEGAPSSAVCCRITGDGLGPASAIPESIAQARVGMIGYVGRQDAPPLRIQAPVVSLATGVAATQSVLAGLIHRQRTGEGAKAVVSMDRSAFILLSNVMVSESDPDERIGHSAQAHVDPDLGYPCSDGSVDIIFNRDDDGFANFCAWLGADHLSSMPEFQTKRLRQRNSEKLFESLKSYMMRQTAQDVVEACRKEGALAARRFMLSEVRDNPQVQYLHLLREADAGAKESGRHSPAMGLPFALGGKRFAVTPARVQNS